MTPCVNAPSIRGVWPLGRTSNSRTGICRFRPCGIHFIIDKKTHSDIIDAMKATLTINMDNAAFNEYENSRGIELARIFHELSRSVDYARLSKGTKINCFDINGNTVGKLEIVED